ncbi:unnamed protein product [Prunus brigantina]
MNGFSLQSTTAPRKACKVAPWEAFGFGVGPLEWLENICMVESDWGKWVVKSAFGIVKHGGVTPINLGQSRPPP